MPVKQLEGREAYRGVVKYRGAKPKHLWTLFREQDESKKPELPFKPVHHHNAFIEDRIHDYEFRNGELQYFSHVADKPVWILLEFEE